MDLWKSRYPFTMNSTTDALLYGWKSRRAWWFTATARTQDRFARTALGNFWLGLSNLLSVAVLGVVYGTVFNVESFASYVVYLGIGLIIWNAIAASVQSAPALFRSNAGNLKNTNLHPIFYTLEEWSFQVQTFIQSFALVILVLSIFQHNLLVNLVTAGILPVINLLLFIYWFPLLLCLAGAHFEDFYQLVPIALQLVFLLTPILYEKKALGALSWTANLNPLYIILSSLRHSIIRGNCDIPRSLQLLAINIAGIFLSVAILERQKKIIPFLV
jgi:lipopolysaccharide transport system permease protein